VSYDLYKNVYLEEFAEINYRFVEDFMKKYKFLIWMSICYILFAIILTILYDVLPIMLNFSVFKTDSFYTSFITNLYNSIFDFIFITVVFTVLIERMNKKDTLRLYKENIDDCRFWFEKEAAFKISGNIRRLQSHNITVYDLSKVFLENVILKELKIENSKFMGSVLSGANFEKSTFINCDFQGAFMIGSIFRNADLSNGNLRYIKAANSNFIGTKAINCKFDYADFSNADLKSAVLKESDFNNVKFENCNLEGANLLGTKNLNIEELCKCKSLKYSKLDNDILEKVKRLYPNLLK